MTIIKTTTSVTILTILLGGLIFMPYSAFAATPSFFASITQPIGVAASPDKLLVTNPYDSSGTREIQAIDISGAVSLFATLPSVGGAVEQYIAISPGLGGFAPNYVYVTQGPNIIKVSPDGSTVSLFANIPSLPSTHTGITFDEVGTFGFKMIVTGAANGEVWTVDSSGSPTLVGTVTNPGGSPVLIEGPAVAPTSFAPYGGQVLLAAESNSEVYAMDSSGTVTPVIGSPGAESVHVIPANPCSFGTTGAAFFSADYPTSIQSYATSDLTGLGGDILVTSESGSGIFLLTTDGTTVSSSSFDVTGYQHEGSALVDCAVPTATAGRMTGGGSIIDPVVGRVTHGFELQCNVANIPNNLEVNWGKGNKFHLDSLTSAVCVNDPSIKPNPPAAGFDTYVGTGTGSYNGVAGATAQWTFTDAGEPGNHDTAKIVIKTGTTTVLSVSGNLINGNQQAHNK